MMYNELAQQIWSEIGRATADRKHPWRYPVLASLHKDRVFQRTLVLRDYIPKAKQLIFYTDYRSPKVVQLQSNSKVSVLFYNPKKQWQLRVEVEAKIHFKDGLSNEHLARIPRGMRKDYESALAPGSKLGDESHDSTAEDNFAVIVLQAKALDNLQLDKEGHRRFRLDLETQIAERLQA